MTTFPHPAPPDTRRTPPATATEKAIRRIDQAIAETVEPPGLKWDAPDRMEWLLEEVRAVYAAVARNHPVGARDHLAHLGAMAVRWLAATYDGVPR